MICQRCGLTTTDAARAERDDARRNRDGNFELYALACRDRDAARAALRDERITSMRLRGEIYRLRDVVTAPDVEAIDELLADLPCVVQVTP